MHRLVISLLCLTLVLAGCQTAGETVSTTESTVCPSCQQEVKTLAVKGLVAEHHKCGGCGTDMTTNPEYPTHYCEHCKTAIGECEVCASKR